MKRFLIFLILPIIFCACSSDQGPSMKVVSYIVEVQDTYPVEKAGEKVEVWKASEGLFERIINGK